MKYSFSYVVEVSDELRRAIGFALTGEDRPATREQMYHWFKKYGYSNNDDTLNDYREELSRPTPQQTP
jgi:hypothetical protein